MSTKLPAGTYFIGDPCYCFDDSWRELLDHTDFFESGISEFKGGFVAAEGTAWGDGTYRGSDGRDYDVDAGMIGAVSVNLYEAQESMNYRGVFKVEFEEDFEVYSEDGVIHIGHIAIDTDPEYDDE